MQIAKFQLEDGRIAKFEVPDNITPEQAFNLVSSQLNELNNPKKQEVAASTTATIPERTYGEVAKDVGAAVATGLGNLGQFPGQLYGLATGNFSDTGLYGKAKELEKYGESLKSPGLVAREKASQARIAEAEKEGQISSFFTTIKEIITDPVQLPNFLISQSLQSIPSIAAALVPLVGPAASAEIKALQIAAKTATSVAAKEIAEKELKDYVADVAIKTGTRQAIGVGAVQQGADIGTGSYEEIYRELISQNVPEEQAAEKALGLARASGASGSVISLLAQKLPGARVLEERLAGIRFGSPGGVGGNIASRLASGVGVGLKEGLTEIPEEVGGKFSQNLAMQQVDPTQTLAEGLGATGGQAFIGGFGLGTVIGSLTNGDSARIAEEKRSFEQAKLQTQKEQALEQQNLTKTQLGITEEQQQFALPAPDELFKQTSNSLFNPFGNYSSADLSINPEVDAYVKQHRQLTGKPNIESYSIEDIQDAMPGTNIAAEKAAIDSFLTAKTGYTPEVSYTAQDIQNVATQKNIETKTKGFNDFLTRTTGINNVAEMSQPQLHAAFTALAQLPKSPDLQILPQGTNATRFTEDQYKKSIENLKTVGNNLSREDALNKIYDQIKVPYVEPVDPIAVNKAPDAEAEQRNKTYFESLQRKNAESILSKALRENDLETVKVPKFDVIAPDGSVTVSPLTRESANRIAEKTEGFTVKESSVEKIAVVDQSLLPKGFDIQQQSFKQNGVPGGYQIKAGNVLISPTAFTTEEEATNKVKSYESVRTKQIESINKQLVKLEVEKTTGQNKLDAMEVSGSSSTPAYRVASAAYDNQVRNINTKVVGLNKQKELLAVPLKIVPTGSAIRSGFTVFEQGIPQATLPTKQAAEEHIIANASDETLQNIFTSPTPNRLRNKANEEINRRAGKVEPGIRVARSPELEEQAVVENQAQMAKLEEILKPILSKFGLNTTKLKVVKEIDGGKAEASYSGIENLVNIAFDAVNPVRALRHESVHSLKELGFFTDGQWKALTNQANTKWVNKYLKQKNVSGNPLAAGEQSRYDAYMKAYDGNQEAVIEEAIADAFADFDINGAPAGFMAALLTKIQNFFKSLLNALNGAGFQTAEDVFGKVERGELSSSKLTSTPLTKNKLSLNSFDQNDISKLIFDGSYNDAALRILNSQITKTSKSLEVDQVGVLFDKAYLNQFKEKGDWKNQINFQSAVSQAVKELEYQIQQSKSGLDWYDQDIAEAFKLTQRFIPSLKKPEKRALFSIIAGIMSPSTNARDNWVIAAQAYQHYEKTGTLPGNNPATGGLWMGGLESANKKKQLDMLNAMLQPKSKGGFGEKGAVEWLQNDHTVKEITDIRFKYGNMGKSSAGGKATDIIPGYTTFGPKVGPFVMNINGLHEVTVDVWMTRTFNRYFGQMMGSDGKMVRAPTEPQRVVIKKLATEAAKKLGIKPYQVQSVLWFFEQQMFNKLGTGAKSYGFSDGAIKFIETQGGVGISPATSQNIGSNAVANQPTGKQNIRVGAQASKPSARADQQATQQGLKDENISLREPTVRPSGRGNKKININPKYSLREDIRSYRAGDEETPTHTARSLGDAGGVRVLGAKPITQYTPANLFKNIVNQYGYQSPTFYEISGKDADVYEQAIQDAKDSNPYGAAVYVYPVDAYKDMRLFLTEDGKSGFALKGDDIVSVFSGPPHKGSVNSSIQLAVQEGGRRLDAFDTVLTDIYHANGFQIVGRMNWNEDYKPDDWDKQTFLKFNNGEPDVVYMAYNPDDNRTVFENPGEYFDDPDKLGQAQKDAVNAYYNEGTGYGSAKQIENFRRLKTQTGTVSGQRGVRGSLQLLDDETRAKYPNLEEPVKGLPATVKVDGVDVTFGPYIAAREAAILYAEESGIPYQQQASYHKINLEFSKILASSYAKMLDEPNNPQVKAAYKAWADETITQYEAMLKTGITVEFFPNSIDTYGNPRKSILDVLNNNHLYVFPVDGGFGKEAITNEQIKNNPALALTDIIISGRRARVVEVFRATHDFFGHIKEGFGFRAEGEENAFQSHVRMYSPLAARAMTAGTRGQNSEVNFGPNAAFNKTASGKDTKYADQKIGLMPEWATTKNIEPNVKYSLGKGIVLGTKQEGSISFDGVHYGKIKTDNLNALKYGTGLQGSESRRLSGYWDSRIKKRVYFYISKYDGTMPLPESGVGGYVYTQKFDNIASPAVISRLYAEARGDSNTLETLIVDAGYDGYAAPSMGMMVILNHDVPVNYEGTKAEFDAKKTNSDIRYSLRDATNMFDPDEIKTLGTTQKKAADLQEKGDIRFSLTQKVNSLPNSSKILDSVNKIISVQEQKGHVERMVAAFSPKNRSNFRAAIIDRYNQIGVNSKQVAKLMGENWLLADVSAEAAANMSDLATGVSASALGVGQGKGGIPVYANGFTKVFNDDGKIKGAVEIFSTLAKYNNPEIYRLYQWWAGSLRGKRLLENGKEQNYTKEDIKLAEELLVSFPEFAQVQKEWIVYNDGLVKYAVDTGVLTKEAGEKFKEYGDYIPFYRQIDGEQTVGPNIFSGISGVKGPKALKGSEAPLADFLETIVRNTQSIIESGMKNVAAERAVRDAVILGQAEKLNFQPKEFKSDVVSYQEKGKTVYYKLADPALYEAMKGLNIPDMPWLGILSAPANLLRTLVTRDPGFMLVNLMRDSVSAWITSGTSMTPIVDTMNQFVKTLAGKSPEAEALMMSGVLGGYDFASNVESGGKDLAKYLRKKTNTKTTTEFLATPFTSVWEALEKGTTASDAATRAAIYRRIMDETGNEAEAIYRALEVLNFNRKGNAAVIRILTAIVPFLNARIQGLDVLYRASFGEMANKDAKAIQKAFLIRSLFLMGITALYYASTSDDEEYKKQEQEVRDNNWLIPSLGIKIPIPFEIGVLFKVIPERIMAYHYGTDTGKDLLESAARNIISTFTFNPVPQAVIPFVETATNYSFFTGREIVPRELKDVSPEFQINARTSGLAKRISSGLADILPSGLKEKALSPIQIDHIVNGYTGTLGMYASSMLNSVFDRSTDPTRADLRFEQMPVFRRILIDKEAKGNVTAYYDLKHSTDTMVRTINLLEKTQNFEELGKYQQENLNLLKTQDYMKDLAKIMKELNEYSVMIKSSKMDGASKRDALLAINQAQNNVTANIKTIRKMLN